jgi:IclR family mhp operon transcriptional activator
MDWPSDLAVRDGSEMLIVKSSRFGGALSFNRRPYHRAPILETSLGLAYLAHCGAEEREEIIEHLAGKSQTGSFADLRKGAFASLIRKIREQGFAAMDSGYREREFENRVDAIGVPILVGEAAVASINVMYLRNALEAGTVQSVLLPKLQAAAAEMGTELSKDQALFGPSRALG